jgi:ferredoxin
VFLLYDRLPLREHFRQAIFAGAAIAVVAVVLAATDALTAGRLALWSVISTVVVGLLTFDYAGSSPTAVSGMAEERRFHIALDLERCSGAYNCWAVCPEACFDKLPELHKVAVTHGDRCIRCGACVVQCPQDALAFETPDGWRVDPEQIRRFKLNMLGRRARYVGAPQA